MYKKSNFFSFGLLILLFITQCHTKSSAKKSNQEATSQQTKPVAATKFDTINEQLHSYSELITDDLIEMKIIDTNLTNSLSETCYCDTTVQLNDSVYYSIISINDEAGVCTHFYIASMNKNSKKMITSKYLHADCDVDYSGDTYELYDHKIISKDKIKLIKTTVFQKKDRTSFNAEENIDHKQIQKSYLTILQTGQINSPN